MKYISAMSLFVIVNVYAVLALNLIKIIIKNCAGGVKIRLSFDTSQQLGA